MASAAAFVPKTTEVVKVAGKSVILYPALPVDAPIDEKCHAYHHNRNALETARIPARELLETMGNRLNGSTFVTGETVEYLEVFNTSWVNPDRFIILSYHNSAGNLINDATDASGLDLKQIQQGDPAICRPNDVQFFKARVICDFARLTENQPCSLQVDYYIELPLSVRNVADDQGVNRVLTT